MRDFTYLAPKTLQEAVEMKLKYGAAARFIAGSTDVVVMMRDYKIAPDYIIDLKGIPGLDRIEEEDGAVRVGALVTMNTIAKNELIRSRFPFLAKAAGSVGSRQVRSRATCVGNLCNASPLADTATPLYALNAEIEIEGPGGARTDPIADFILGVRKIDLKEGEVVTGVRIPDQQTRAVFYKMARREQVDLSTVCGTVARGEDGWRVAMGAVAITPLRLPGTEELLNGAEKIDDEVIERAAALGQTEVKPIGDVRADRQYRLDMVAYIIRHGVRDLI